MMMTSVSLVTSRHWATDYMTPTDVTQAHHADTSPAGTINKVTASLLSTKITLSAQMDHTFVQYRMPEIEFYFFVCKWYYPGSQFTWQV